MIANAAINVHDLASMLHTLAITTIMINHQISQILARFDVVPGLRMALT